MRIKRDYLPSTHFRCWLRRSGVPLTRKALARRAGGHPTLQLLAAPVRSPRTAAALLLVGILCLGALPAFAADQDPAGVVGRTTNFLLNLLMGVGICFIAFGVLSLAISFQSHDDSQKSRAVMAIMGGAIAVSVRYVIQIVAPNAGISI